MGLLGTEKQIFTALTARNETWRWMQDGKNRKEKKKLTRKIRISTDREGKQTKMKDNYRVCKNERQRNQKRKEIKKPKRNTNRQTGKKFRNSSRKSLPDNALRGQAFFCQTD